MRILRSLAQDRGLPYVAALEVRQATPELFPLLDALTCARLGISVGTFPQEASHLERPRNEALALPSREEALDRIPFPEAWAAARDLGRALGLPAELRRRLTKTLGRDFRHLSPHRAREAEPLFREVLGEAPVKELLLRLLSLMEKGHVRHLMPHVGGVVVAPGPLTRYAPMVRSAGGVRMLTLDKDDLEALGLVKLDLLGLRMLSALEEAREEVFRTEGVWLDLEALPQEEGVYRPLWRGETLGVFQLESPAQTAMSRRLRPRTGAWGRRRRSPCTRCWTGSWPGPTGSSSSRKSSSPSCTTGQGWTGPRRRPSARRWLRPGTRRTWSPYGSAS